ncbi:MAG: hypothetical protein ACLFV3_06865 [Phycisphaeraceae bacterium]
MSSGNGHIPPAGANGAARCIVWLAPGQIVPGELLLRLSQRQVKTLLATDPSSVMVQLADGPAVAVVVIDPPRQPSWRELAEAVERYYPRTAVWSYQAPPGSDRRQLGRLIANHQPIRTPPPTRARGAPASPGRAVKESPPAEPGPVTLSAEELAMLLGPDEGESDSQEDATST